MKRIFDEKTKAINYLVKSYITDGDAKAARKKRAICDAVDEIFAIKRPADERKKIVAILEKMEAKLEKLDAESKAA